LERYVAFLAWIQGVQDWSKLKFLDESHFVTRKLSGAKVWGLQSSRRYTADRSLHGPNFSVTLIMNLGDRAEPLWFDFRSDSNDQVDYLETLTCACESGVLTNGDFLIVDNAAVHHGEDTVDLVDELLGAFGVRLVFLPAYSPELNPCELVFADAKGDVRNSDDVERQSHIFELVTEAFAKIPFETLENYFFHCIFPRHVLPDCDL
jgi:transposase